MIVLLAALTLNNLLYKWYTKHLLQKLEKAQWQQKSHIALFITNFVLNNDVSSISDKDSILGTRFKNKMKAYNFPINQHLPKCSK